MQNREYFSGGFVLTGGHSIADIKDLTTIGKRDKTGIDVEVDSAGYGNSKKVEVYLENLRLIDGGFDIGVDSGSIVVGKNIFAEAPFNLYSKNSKARFYQCKFGVGPDDRIIFPNDVKFAECEFYASGRKFKSINKYVIAAPFIAWNISGTNEKNQSLTFTDCSFIADDRVAGLVEPIFGIYTGWDAVDFNNVLTLNGGRFFIKKGTGMGMMYRGGNWVVKNTVFDTDLALFINGFPDQLGQSWFDIVLDGILVKRGHYAHIVGYGPQVAGLSNKNKLEQHHIVVAEDVNYISSTYGLEGNQNIGSRIIQGVNPPTDATHGLVGDIYQLKASSRKWRCTKSGYQIIKNSDKRKIESQWQLIED